MSTTQSDFRYIQYIAGHTNPRTNVSVLLTNNPPIIPVKKIETVSHTTPVTKSVTEPVTDTETNAVTEPEVELNPVADPAAEAEPAHALPTETETNTAPATLLV